MKLLNKKNDGRLAINMDTLTSKGFEFEIFIGDRSVVAEVIIDKKVRGRSEVDFSIRKNGRFLGSDEMSILDESGFWSVIRDVVAAAYMVSNRKKKSFFQMSEMMMMSKRKAEKFYESFKKNSPEKCPEIYEDIKSQENWCYIAGPINRLVPVSEFFGFGAQALSIAYEKAMWGSEHFLKV